MGIGASIFLIALGAIIVFGITGDNIWWLDLDAVGWVLIATGLAGFALTMWYWRLRRRHVAKPKPVDDDRGMYPEDAKFTEEHRTEVHPPERRY
jgi:membrane protein implicated in regulation of membrane protease activity